MCADPCSTAVGLACSPVCDECFDTGISSTRPAWPASSGEGGAPGDACAPQQECPPWLCLRVLMILIAAQRIQDGTVGRASVTRAGGNQRGQTLTHALKRGDTLVHVYQFRLRRALDARH